MQTLLNRWVIGSVAVAACALLLYSQLNLRNAERFVRWRFDTVPQLSTSDLLRWLNDKGREPPILLDIRMPEEYEVSHLQGAVRIDPNAEPQALFEQLDSNRPIVVYCSVGYRSSRLAAKLIKAGRKNIWNLQGSIFAWSKEGRPLMHGDKPTKEVHPVNRFYSLFLK